MQNEQKIFWTEIQKIQDTVVNVSLIKAQKYDSMEELLNDVTYETICALMELLDGYRNEDIYGEITSRGTGSKLNSNVELHDCCEEYLKCSDK